MKLMPGVGIEGSPNYVAGAEAVARVDAMFLERMRQIHIGPSLVYPAVGAVPHITIALQYYTATRGPYLTLVTAHCPPGTSNRGVRLRLTMPSWKEQKTARAT